MFNCTSDPISQITVLRVRELLRRTHKSISKGQYQRLEIDQRGPTLSPERLSAHRQKCFMCVVFLSAWRLQTSQRRCHEGTQDYQTETQVGIRSKQLARGCLWRQCCRILLGLRQYVTQFLSAGQAFWTASFLSNKLCWDRKQGMKDTEFKPVLFFKCRCLLGKPPALAHSKDSQVLELPSPAWRQQQDCSISKRILRNRRWASRTDRDPNPVLVSDCLQSSQTTRKMTRQTKPRTWPRTVLQIHSQQVMVLANPVQQANPSTFIASSAWINRWQSG